MRPEYSTAFITRFWSKVDKTGDCWIWTDKPTMYGYGRISIGDNRNRMAHRVAYELTYGTLDDDTLCCHHCDNRVCVRPEHLFVGTHDDNMRDMVEKSRQATGDRNASRLRPWKVQRGEDHYTRRNPEQRSRGEKHGAARLTADQVRDIRQQRAQGIPPNVLAERFGIRYATVWAIVRRKIWKHLE